ncbi:hypothetical protein HNV11_03435 [Spirosoma taeanense]|uniref:Capsule assembly Wzi family protein n=1 Tax=Spirosoma taeanense TaxID=2735870 RepID=A0A6M5Y5J6_9BACT|nr:capsule assembly Wzi family protein [Spirosoma taeanense]QJW88491.1 hypothetical protein HNV11_03435 [Spirosoma taeanense]
MKIRLLSFAIGLMVTRAVTAQVDSSAIPSRHSAIYSVELTGLAASGNRTPFWLQANQYGIVPRNSPAGFVTVGTNGRFGNLHKGLNRGLSYGLEAVGHLGNQSGVILPQAFASIDRDYFSLWVGRKKEIIGLGDSTLSSGFYSWSGNALPITKLQLGTNQFMPLGFTSNIISVHAFYAHGWFANSDSIQQSYLHQKAFYVRIGRPNWRVRLTGGVLHSAQWGGHSRYMTSGVARNGQLPDSFRDYLYVITAKQPDELESATHTAFDGINRFGNHLGSIDFGLETRLGQWQTMGYYQHPFEDKSGTAFVNFPDGLYGLRLQHQGASSGGFQIRHLLLEFLNTMSQSGSLVHTGRYDGQDDYFNNFQYINGWTQHERVIGTPFLSRRADLRPERQNEPNKRIWAIANNRVQMAHIGLAGTVGRSGIRWQSRLSVSRNFGTHRFRFVEPVPQVSGAAWLTWPLTWLGGSELRTAVAVDQGQLYSNAVGGWISLRKVWKTTH